MDVFELEKIELERKVIQVLWQKLELLEWTWAADSIGVYAAVLPHEYDGRKIIRITVNITQPDVPIIGIADYSPENGTTRYSMVIVRQEPDCEGAGVFNERLESIIQRVPLLARRRFIVGLLNVLEGLEGGSKCQSSAQ